MMARLHPVVLDEIGLVAAIELMVDYWNVHHEDCFCSVSVWRSLPTLHAAARIGLYRIAQEALTNIARHARASQATIELRVDNEQGGAAVLELCVSDNGRGCVLGEQRRGLGLSGMRERAQALGGGVHLDTAPGAGLRLRVRLPLAMLLETESPLA